MPIIIIALIALLGGGASVAAEHALPGDVLYPVKVHVNEQVRSVLAFTVEDRAAWEAERAERRLEEAGELSVREKIAVDVRAQIEANFKAFADRVQERIKALEASGDVEAAANVASRFEIALNAHDRILERLAARDAESRSELQSLETRVHVELDETVRDRVEAEAKIAARAHAETAEAAAGKINAAENVLASVQSYIQNWQDTLGATATAQAQTRVSAAQALVVQAKARVGAKAYGEAFNLAQAAIRTAQGARVLIEVQGRLNAEVRASMSPSPSSSPNPTASSRVRGGVEAEERININLGL